MTQSGWHDAIHILGNISELLSQVPKLIELKALSSFKHREVNNFENAMDNILENIAWQQDYKVRFILLPPNQEFYS